MANIVAPLGETIIFLLTRWVFVPDHAKVVILLAVEHVEVTVAIEIGASRSDA